MESSVPFHKQKVAIKYFHNQGFPGGPVVKTPSTLPLQGTWILSLVRELRSCMLRGVDQKNFPKSFHCIPPSHLPWCAHNFGKCCHSPTKLFPRPRGRHLPHVSEGLRELQHTAVLLTTRPMNYSMPRSPVVLAPHVQENM